LETNNIDSKYKMHVVKNSFAYILSSHITKTARPLYHLHNSNSQELNRIAVIHKAFNSHMIIVCQPRKKWGEELVIGQSSRPDNVLSLLACANSINFQDVFPLAKYVSICTRSHLFAVSAYQKMLKSPDLLQDSK
jgi:hypothetical protein